MKAILVIDMPLSINCEDLECYEAELKIIDKDVDEYVLSKRHLPLKLMPPKLAENFGNDTPTNTYIMNGTERQYLDMFAVGYNRCIDEILGEQE